MLLDRRMETAAIPRKKIRIGIIDLVSRAPTTSPYSRIVNPLYTSLMPQMIGVWAEEMGHSVEYVSYTGFEDLFNLIRGEIDIVFISTFTHAALTAYALSDIYRKKGVVTVLGGPHARSYAADSKHYFDYVLGLTDKELLQNLLGDFSPHPEEAVYVTASQQPKSLPGIRQRWRFIQHNLQKTRFVRAIQMTGSLGCPYTCSFCIDSRIEYQPLPYDQIREDLKFLASLPKPPRVGWYDPNFGVRFNDYLDIIEESVPPGRISFGAESSLSLLTEANLRRLQKNHFLVMLPGIESWFDFNLKSKQRHSVGMEKVKAVSEQVNMVMRYIPYVQTNFIFGLDGDAGPEPFELTKRFVDLVPAAYPNYAFITSFGNSAPLSQQYQKEGRVIDIPFPFLDGNCGLNVRPKNYSFIELYDHLIDLVNYSFSNKRVWKRFRASHHPLPRWMNLLRAKLAGKGLKGNYSTIRNQVATNREFQAFFSGESHRPPSYYRETVRAALGNFYEAIPLRARRRNLDEGESMPNPRISNAIHAF